MKFGRINHIILFGGSRCCAELSLYLKENVDYQLDVFTSERQLKEKIYPSSKTLRDYFSENSIPFTSTKDINEEPQLKSLITENSLGLGIGEAWAFAKNIIDQAKFKKA